MALFPWPKPSKPQKAVHGGVDAGQLFNAAMQSRYDELYRHALQQGYGQQTGPPFVPTTVALPEDSPASEIFERIEAHPGYGAAFKRIMRDINTELEAKDKRIKDLESQLETAGAEWAHNYSN